MSYNQGLADRYAARFEREEQAFSAACARWRDGDPVVIFSSWDSMAVCVPKTSSCADRRRRCDRCPFRCGGPEGLLAMGQHYRDVRAKDLKHCRSISLYGV